ncbi:hypothetical protein RM11_1211 [Bartonella quintana RM-11]|nr:hypothetical protein RM11_1211 [Bartonella quintana RM-11]
MRAMGANPRIATVQGVYTSGLIYFGMGLANACVALGSSLYIQTVIATNMTGGVGTIVFGLAAIIIGETLFRPRNIFWSIISCIVGSITTWQYSLHLSHTGLVLIRRRIYS